jgi:translation initiation factor 2B subunit (eIF-2B alpha/beta/delta family)
MKQADNELLYKLFRDHEDIRGESKTTLLALEALITSIHQLKCGKNEIERQVSSLFETIKNSEPRIIPLINLIASCEAASVNQRIFDKSSLQEIKNSLISFIKESIEHYKTNIARVIDHGSSLVGENDIIVVHSASSIVLRTLVKAKEEGKTFNVIILKQDFIKTRQIIETLDEAEIAYTIISEHNLIHYIDRASIVLLGASSVTCDEKFIAAVGTTSVVDICHLQRIPLYLLVDTLKFSYIICDEHRIHRKIRKESQDGMEYSYIQYSHDKVELKYVDHIITEKGEISMDEVRILLHG